LLCVLSLARTWRAIQRFEQVTLLVSLAKAEYRGDAASIFADSSIDCRNEDA
jgi:hypothetical protein